MKSEKSKLQIINDSVDSTLIDLPLKTMKEIEDSLIEDSLNADKGTPNRQENSESKLVSDTKKE